MENNITLEQPVDSLSCDQGAAAQNELGLDNKLSGSNTLGKFKDADSLLQAYNNLQSEFTKKCQTLSTLTKTLEENKENSLPSKQKIALEKIDEFLATHQNFLESKQDIIELIPKDQDFSPQEIINSIISNYAINNFKSEKDMVKDNNFLKNFIYNNDKIKQVIIQQYFDDINLNKAPQVISNHKGAHSPITPKSRPKDLKEAGNMVRAMFKN